MSIDYVAYVEAVGPVEQIALFKRRAQALRVGATLLGQRIKVDQPEYVAFGEVTSGPVRTLPHQPPETYYYAIDCATAPELSGLTFRTVLVTEALNVEEHVLRSGKELFSQKTQEKEGARDGQDGMPELVQIKEGDAQAWVQACIRYGVEPAGMFNAPL